MLDIPTASVVKSLFDMNTKNQSPSSALAALASLILVYSGRARAQEPGQAGEDGGGLAPVFVNLQTEGNLKSSRATPLESLDQATSADTPVDFMDLSGRGAKTGEFDEAAKAFAVAIAYAQYDSQRVTDQTALQGIQVLIAEKMDGITEEQAFGVQAAGQQFTSDGGAALTAILERLGRPSYHPDYLIQHGLGALTGESSGQDELVQDFDGESAWQAILEEARTLGGTGAGESSEEGE